MTKEECEIETSKAIMEMRNHIAELEKENAELKEVHESDKRSLALIAKKGAESEKAYNEAEELLDKQIEATLKLLQEFYKAKEIIKDLLGSENTSCEEEMFFEIRQKAEDFLKEGE